MKILLLFLLLSTAAWGQDSTTTKIFRDVYGNWYNSSGSVETKIVGKNPIHKDTIWRTYAEDSTYIYEYRVRKKPAQFKISTGDQYWIYASEDGRHHRLVENRRKSVENKPTRLDPATYDIVLHVILTYEKTNNKEDKVFIDYAGERIQMRPYYRNGRVFIQLNNTFLKL